MPEQVLSALESLLDQPELKWLLVAAIGCLLLRMNALRQRARRDPQRFFDAAQKRALKAQADYRCEHKPLIGPRCRRTGTEADHVVPWSKGGPTALWNGQMLCRMHNRRKSNLVPSHFYRWRLRRRRRRRSAVGSRR